MMFWEDLLLRREVTAPELTHAIATLFAIPEEHVLTVDEVAAISGPLGDDVKVLVERTPACGEFALGVSIYVRDPKLDRSLRREKSTLPRVQRFCELAGTDCLASDDSLNSETWQLIKPGAQPMTVILDGDRLDHDEYVIAEVMAPIS